MVLQEKFDLYKVKEAFIVLVIIVYSFIIFDKPLKYIESDGFGYYSYLPATFIYHDFDYQFLDSIRTKYFNGEGHKFEVEINGKTVNKTWPGLAILWLPFFLIAHLLTLLSSLPPDGYSAIYQYSVLLASFFYLFIGINYLGKFLKISGFDKFTIFFTQFIIVFATPLLAYSSDLVSFTHAYSFTLVAIFFFYIRKASFNFKSKYIILAAISLGFIAIVRPVNGLIIFAIPFLCGSKENLIRFFQNLFSNKKTLIISTLIFLLILSIVPILLKIQSDQWLVWQYRNRNNNTEKVGFNFLDPNFFKFLFSYRNGLFVYSPILFISLLGLIPLFKKSKFQFYWILLSLIIVVYVLSSWHSWYYGASFGMRVIVEFLPLFAVLFASLISNRNKVIKISLISISAFFIVLSFIQHNQFKNYIFYWKMDKEIYWDVFLKTNAKYRGVWWDKKRNYIPPKQAKTLINNSVADYKKSLNIDKFPAKSSRTEIFKIKLDSLYKPGKKLILNFKTNLLLKENEDPLKNKFLILIKIIKPYKRYVTYSEAFDFKNNVWKNIEIPVLMLEPKKETEISIIINNKNSDNGYLIKDTDVELIWK